MGVPLGIARDETSRALLRSPNKTHRVLGYVLNPLYLLPGARSKPVYFQASVSPPALLLTFRF
ncbi:MAG: hypothetical protein ACYTDU_03250 [Planctomycetota bacterium]|jgi:hypothetical protein